MAYWSEPFNVYHVWHEEEQTHTVGGTVASEFKVGVVGAGYVGLVTGACLARLGHQVTGIDKDGAKVEALGSGKVPIYEPGLEEMVADGLRRERLSFTTSIEEGVAHADIMFIAVDTPQGDDGAADLTNVSTVARTMGSALSEIERERPLVVVNKSTVPVGSGDYVSMLVQEGAGERNSINYLVVSNPEFLREGSAVYDTLFPDRIVLGGEKREALDTMRELYKPIIEQNFPTELDPRPRAAVPFVTTDLASAEMIKYAANAFLATKISFANEIANLCELVGADAASVTCGMGLDERIGPRFLNSGIGWGGSCFPKDVAALRSTAREYDYEPLILDSAVAVNERQRKQVVAKLQRDLHTLKGKRVALLGLAFKPNTDDLRDAPSLTIARSLHSLGARVSGYDPVAGKEFARRFPEARLFQDPYEALEGAHAAVVVTEWEEMRSLDLSRAASLMAGPRLLIDGRNILSPEGAKHSGLLYKGFGRG